MKLINLLEVISENITISIYKDGYMVCNYNGKDSIDEDWNDYEVLKIEVCENKILIDIE